MATFYWRIKLTHALVKHGDWIQSFNKAGNLQRERMTTYRVNVLYYIGQVEKYILKKDDIF